MSIGRHRLQKSVKGLNKVKLDEITEVPGILGITLGGKKLVEVPNREGYVYIRLHDNLSELIQAKNSKVSPVYGLPVLVYRDKIDKTKWIVKGRDEGRYANWGTSAYLPRHGAQHSFDPDNPGGDPVWVWGRQMMPLAAIPSGSNGGPNVLIEPYTYWRNNTWHYAGATGTQDILPSYKPTGSNARMVLVYLNSAGNPSLLGGSTYFATNLTGTSDVISYIPGMPDTESIGIAGIRLVSGTSVITWNEIYDIRPWIVGNGYVPTGTTAGVTDHGALTGLLDNDHPQYLLTGTQIDHGGLAGLLDNDHPQYLLTGTAITDEKAKVSSNDTTAGYLNGKFIEGAGISLTEVGDGGNETLRISYTGTSGGGGSTNILVYDDNIFKVTGTAFSFNDGLKVHVTGSVAYIDWTGSVGAQGEAGPPGSNTLLIYDDSVFKVTGTSTSFNRGLKVYSTGSVAFIDSTLDWFNVKDYGAIGDGVVDDTTAIQNTINAAKDVGGGTVYFPRGTYIIGGALQDISGANSQLTLPQVHVSDDEWMTIALVGESSPVTTWNLVGTNPLPQSGTIIKSTLNTGTNGALLGAYGPIGSFGNFSGVHIHLQDLSFQLPTNPVLTALNLNYCIACGVHNVVIRSNTMAIDQLTQPTTATSYGLKTPKISNGAYIYLNGLTVVGYYNGIQVNEHTNGVNTKVAGCINAFRFALSGGHSSYFGRIAVEWCTNGLIFDGAHPVLIDLYNVEHHDPSTPKWYDNTYDLSDAGNVGSGYIVYHALISGTGADDPFIINGGTGLYTRKLEDSIVSTLFNDTEGNPIDVDETTSADGTSGYAARRDHRHQLTSNKVKVSSNDTTSGYLNGKLIQGIGISLVENNNGGNETLTIAYTGTNCGTYQRVGRPIALSSITGIAWSVPGYVYASGSLAIYANGSILTPDINYYEQFYVSGTYILNSIYTTGTVFVAMWGVPCTPQVFLSTGTGNLFAILDSNDVALLDSNDIQILDSNG